MTQPKPPNELTGAEQTGAMGYIYVGRTRPKRKGQPCKLLTTWRRKAPHNVLVEFEDDYQMVCPMRCLRKQKTAAQETQEREAELIKDIQRQHGFRKRGG